MNIKTILIGVCVAGVMMFSSCDKDASMAGPLDKGDDNFLKDWGVVTYVGGNNYFEIHQDNRTLLYVTEYMTPDRLPQIGERVMYNYSILREAGLRNGLEYVDKAYYVKIRGFYDIISLPLERRTVLNQNEDYDSELGDDGLLITAWFGGEYINIEYAVWRVKGANTPYKIAMEYDDTVEDQSTVVLKLRHNAYGAVPGLELDLEKVVGHASFKVSDLIPEGQQSVEITLLWNEYASDESMQIERKSSSMIFRPFMNNNSKMLMPENKR